MDDGSILIRLNQIKDCEDAEHLAAQVMYDAMWLLEKMERNGLISGNGHHIRQNLAEDVKRLVRERWVGPGTPV